ncbi:allophanate hydrolase [Pseudomonas sp. MAG002Y]|uniref:allophanate hydrolase n=1 Tax=Pseudomonas sp. MAG002Y TaxID=2678690 RepID=UPI001C60D5E8|nr:allophanate hydrolase [Pseudomonas sp. MAG002Y]MBW5415248.1 allophanate hydrolase [Pseudomonas sp. MAG002Y]
MSAYAINQLTRRYLTGETTPSQTVRALSAAILAGERPETWIYRVSPEQLLARAFELEQQASRLGEALWETLPLYGIPFAVKDNIDVAGLPTTAACPEFSYEAQNNASVVQRLLDAGAILVGKTNLDQFATGLVGVRSPYGIVRNAVDEDYVSGGSSSGSAVAVALGYVAFALGTDTAGSGRIPAGFNAIVGLKPSLGLLSSRGLVPACRSIDSISIFAADAASAWQVARIVAHYDPEDAFSRSVPMRPIQRRQRRVAVPAELEFFGDNQAAEAFAQSLERLRQDPSVTLSTVPFDVFTEAAALLYQGPWVAERRAAVGQLYTDQPDVIHPVVRAILAEAGRYSAVDTFNALYRLKELTHQAKQLLAGIDLLLVPTAPCLPTIEQVLADPFQSNTRLGYYTNFVNLMDMAAFALPAVPRQDGLPAGITLIGPAGSDHYLAETAASWQPLFGGENQSDEIALAPLDSTEPSIDVAVVGAHLWGQPLNWQLLESGARRVACTTTSVDYRLYALANTEPAKPGLVRVTEQGVAIELEVWTMPLRHFGAFVAAIPAPLGIGSVELVDGRWVKGFICEPVGLVGAEDISRFNGWRAYRASL